MPRPFHIVFASGAVPANLYAGLAVAAHVHERLPDARITFVGPGKSLRHVVRTAGFRCAHLPSQPAPRNALHAVRFVTDNVAGYWASRWFLREEQVSLVVGMGGYASAATMRAAIARGVPTVLWEQNAVPGRATRWLAPSAAAICVGFAEAQAYLPSHLPVVVTGNPCRPAIHELYEQQTSGGRVAPPNSGRAATLNDLADGPARRRLIVLGGAGGARSLNEWMPSALQQLGGALGNWQVVHQSGDGQLHETLCRYREAGVDALVVALIEEIASVVFDSDLVICRAAGTTLAELALAGVPTVIVPHPQAADAYQLANAEIFAAAGAAALIDETELVSSLDQALADQLRPLLADDRRREAMSVNMRRLARPDAAAHIAGIVYELLCGKVQRLAA